MAVTARMTTCNSDGAYVSSDHAPPASHCSIWRGRCGIRSFLSMLVCAILHSHLVVAVLCEGSDTLQHAPPSRGRI